MKTLKYKYGVGDMTSHGEVVARWIDRNDIIWYRLEWIMGVYNARFHTLPEWQL